MAWLSDLAGKAETLLNKIDKNTAAVLSIEKNDRLQVSGSSNVNNSPRHIATNVVEPKMTADSPRHSVRSARSVVNTESSPRSSLSKKQQDEELMNYLNTPSATPTKNSVKIIAGPSTPSSLVVELSTDNSDSTRDSVAHSERASPEPLRIDISDDESPFDAEINANLTDENFSLRREVEKLRDELILTSSADDNTDKGRDGFREKLDALRREYEYKLTEQRLETERLTETSRRAEEKKSRAAEKNDLSSESDTTNKRSSDRHNEIEGLRGKLKYYENEIAENGKKLNETQASLERCRMELNATRIDLEQHRARALKTLQEKEKLIAELKNDSRSGSENDATIMELEQLRQECEVLREENQQVSDQLHLSREELINLDLRVEDMSRKIIEANREAHEIVSAERSKRIEAEEDARVHSEEVRTLREEMEIQRGNWSAKFRKQETEITRLRSQLSAASTPSSAVESRLASLTQTLVSKQQALESLTTEKNALRLQLEKIEQEYREMVADSRKNCYNSVNDTDDAKAQVPTFFIETPFDTGVTRRVKRAYSTLDAISVRTGVFLRRYPLARIFIVIYMALLQFWVLVVLFSQSPEAH